MILKHRYDEFARLVISYLVDKALKDKDKDKETISFNLDEYAKLTKHSSIFIEDDYIDFVDYLTNLEYKKVDGKSIRPIFYLIEAGLNTLNLGFDKDFITVWQKQKG